MENKICLVTGSNGGIGSAIVIYFQRQGWKVVGVDLHKKNQSSSDEYFSVDLRSENQIKIFLNKIKKKYPVVNSFIHCAAIEPGIGFMKTTSKQWDEIFQINAKAPFFMIQSLSKSLKRGSVIFISSIHARCTSENIAVYAATKGALSALTRALALDLAPFQIRVNSILPGAVDTLMLHKSMSRRGGGKKVKIGFSKLRKTSPLKRIGTPADIAHLALFLSNGNLSQNITGQEFVSDSGVSARLPSE